MGRSTVIRAAMVGFVLLCAPVAPASAQKLEAPFAGPYTLSDIGTPAGIPSPLGGLVMKAGTTDRLLIGGDANREAGALYEVGVTRDASGHINGFTGPA